MDKVTKLILSAGYADGIRDDEAQDFGCTVQEMTPTRPREEARC